MICPGCASADDVVIDSRELARGQAIRRRRRCGSCGTRWTTYERMDSVHAATLNEQELDRILTMLDQLRNRLIDVRTRTHRVHNIRAT